MSKFPCSLTRRITPHSMENSGFQSLFMQMKDDYTNSHYLAYIVVLKRWEECTFWYFEPVRLFVSAHLVWLVIFQKKYQSLENAQLFKPEGENKNGHDTALISNDERFLQKLQTNERLSKLLTSRENLAKILGDQSRPQAHMQSIRCIQIHLEPSPTQTPPSTKMAAVTSQSIWPSWRQNNMAAVTSPSTWPRWRHMRPIIIVRNEEPFNHLLLHVVLM